MSGIDASQAEPANSPDIILGDDWDEQARIESSDAEERASNTTSRLSFGGSSLARKIITFNLLALVVLVGGVLYLNQFREGLVRQSEAALKTEARLIARLLELNRQTSGSPDLLLADSAGLTHMGVDPGHELFVFAPGGDLLARTHKTEQPDTRTRPQTTMITDLLNVVWRKTTDILGHPAAEQTVGTRELAERIAPEGLAGAVKGINVSTTDGDLIFAVTAPLLENDNIVGALVLATTSDEIGKVVRNEREQVLQMFVVAILVSVGLSLVLAGTIANPLRDLARAAEQNGAKSGSSHAQSRVRIPDMTGRPDEIGALSGSIRKMTSALYDRIDSNEQFAADVSHEIKNPLSSLRSAVDSLRLANDDDKRERLLAVIEHDVRRLDRLVSDISNASRLDSELIKEEMKAFDLVLMLRNLVTYHELEAREIGADFVADLPEDQIIIMGLEERLAQVFVNLLTNAISFCHEGDAVKLWVRQRDDRVLVVVEDTGPGIPEEALEKIFSRFYSDRPPSDYGNHSGLGLAISRQIVLAHGGVIWAENIRPTDADITSEPHGARFVTGLPV